MSTATLAVAGARKTQSIVDTCAATPLKKRLVLTYTLNGQRDLEQRLQRTCAPGALPAVMGWYSFLLRHWVQPFLPLLFPGRRLAGLNFDGLPETTRQGWVSAKGAARFLDDNSRAYKRFLSKLAIDVAAAANGTVITRLQRMYEEFFIDEVQDLTGYDLDVLEHLLKSPSTVHMVGDLRQSVFDTNAQDPRNKKYRGLQMIDWFRAQEKAKRLELRYSSETWRSNQSIATFSDSLFDTRLGFPPTISRQATVTDHDGVYAVATEDVPAYLLKYRPACLRASVSTSVPPGIAVNNFGLAKGLTHERVLIFLLARSGAFCVTVRPCPSDLRADSM